MKIIILAFSIWSCQAVRGEVSCATPSVPNAQPANELKTLYTPGDTHKFVCDSGYVFEGTKYAVCEDGAWRLPVCKHKMCAAPDVPNAKADNELATSYADGRTVKFACDSGYEFEGTQYALCEDGNWRLPVCKKPTSCAAPRVLNSRPTGQLEQFYRTGTYVTFECDRGYEFVGEHYAQCERGAWKLPVCKPQGETVCVAPRVPNAQPAVAVEAYYATGHTVRFACDQGYKFEGTSFAICEDGTWSLPVCKSAGGGVSGGSAGPDAGAGLMPVSGCGSHLLIEDGDAAELPGGMELKVQCKRLYKLEGPESVRCVDGKWTELPVCKPPCKLDRTRIHHSHTEEYLQEGEEKKFYCRTWYKITIRCSNGTAIYGECRFSG